MFQLLTPYIVAFYIKFRAFVQIYNSVLEGNFLLFQNVKPTRDMLTLLEVQGLLSDLEILINVSM